MTAVSEAVERAFTRSTDLFAELVAVQRRLTFVSELLKLNQTIADRNVWDAEYSRIKIEWTAARQQFEESNSIFIELKRRDGRR